MAWNLIGFSCANCICKIYPKPFWQYHSCRHTDALAHIHTTALSDQRTLAHWHWRSGVKHEIPNVSGLTNWETKQLHVPCNLIKRPRNACIHHSNTVSDTHAIESVSESVIQTDSERAIE